MKTQKIIIFLVVIFLLPLLLVENVSKADEVDKGNYIKVKLQVDAIGSDKVYNAYASSGSAPADNPFNVTGTSYLGNECALLLSEKNLAWDDLYIVWVENEVIIGRGTSLSNDIGGNYDRCCHGIDSAAPNTSCLTDAGEARCKWNGPTDGDVCEVFERSYANLENQCPSDAVCEFAPPIGGDRSYGEFSDMLCETEWRMCLGPSDTCHPYNGRDYACNNSSGDWQWENCSAAGKTCVSGACVMATGLSLSAMANPDTIALGGSSIVTFKVTKGEDDVSGATVSGISVTGGGSISAGPINDCLVNTTNGSGECTVTYNAPAVSTVATIKATKASKGGETDSGSASDTVTVTSCTANTFVKFGSSSYDVGDTLNIQWRVGAPEPDNDYIVCIYNEVGNDVWDENIVHFSGGANLGNESPITADAAGTWMASLSIGFSCPDPPDGCIDSATVSAAGPPPCTTIITCSPTSACSGVPGSMTIDITCIDTGTCAAPPITSSPSCCVTNADCAGTDVCDTSTAYGTCQACSGEGVDPGNEDLCCLGLGYWDMDGDGTDECTSACDPNAWFFCNPLRGSVETIVQAGETLLGYILGLIGSIALLFIIIAGMMYMTSAGNEERISSSKRILHGAVIGLTIALLAYGLLHVIMTVLGM